MTLRLMAAPRYTLSGLLRWASAELAGETPVLEHSVSLTDDGGAPQMKRGVQGYLGFLPSNTCVQGHKFCDRHAPRDEEPDNWRRLACARVDGRYRTPVRCAIESINPPERRLFLRDVLANALFPSDVARAHGIPDWAAGDVLYRSLVLLRERYDSLIHQVPERGWISGRSDAQRAAEGEVA